MHTYKSTEHFHLLFLAQLSKRVSQNLLALKGGCNLRFFFKSIRYSEDIDFDIQKISSDTLRSNVRSIFKAKAFLDTLQAGGISISRVSEPKQTDTTQRWKILLRLENIDREIPTKIEFSRRDGIEGSVMEPIDRDILARYQLYPITACHYPRPWAVQQKIGALIGRAETQARDLFDLSHLLHDTSELQRFLLRDAKIKATDIEQACNNAESLNYDHYRGQVVDYLMPEYQKLYGTRQEWKRIVSTVLDFLTGLR